MKFLLIRTLILSLIMSFMPLLANPLTNNPVYEIGREFNKQLICMAKNIYFESAMEPYEGKLAVAQVVKNRTNSNKFPSDICGVVYQRTGSTCQFTWTCSKETDIRNKYAWEESLYIAKKALTEVTLHDDIAKSKALYYHATYVSPEWNNMRIVRKIGNHIFYTKI